MKNIGKDISKRANEFLVDSLDNRKNHYKKLVRYSIPVFFVFAFIILIWGFFYGIANVKYPDLKNEKEVFPEDSYQSASDYYKSVTHFKYLDFDELIKANYNSFWKTYLENPNFTPEKTLQDYLDSKFRGQYLIIQSYSAKDKSVSFLPVDNFIDQKDKEINDLKEKFKNSDYFARHEISSNIDVFQKEKDHAIKFKRFYENLRFNPKISYRYSNTELNFTFVACKLDSYTISGNEFVIKSELKPVTDPDFLRKAGITKTISSSEVESLNKIKSQHQQDIINRFNSLKLDTDKRVSELREKARGRFYKSAFINLVNLIISYYSTILLYLYYAVLRRKGIPKKNTHEVYFATNTTALILRNSALLIIVLGMILILLNALLAFFSMNWLPHIFKYGAFIAAVLNPIFVALGVVLTTWFIVLASELICFVSNVYHNAFNKAYNIDFCKDNEENGEV